MWKQSFSKAEGEYVAEMVMVYQKGKYLCEHAAFF